MNILMMKICGKVVKLALLILQTPDNTKIFFTFTRSYLKSDNTNVITLFQSR